MTIPPARTETDPVGAAVPEAVQHGQVAPGPQADPNASTPDGGTASTWVPAQWHGRMIVDSQGSQIGKLRDVYVDVETDEPKFATVRQGFLPRRHLTFVPLEGVQVDPEELRVAVPADLVRSAPDLDLHGEEMSQADESALYHHFQQNYTPMDSPSGRRLARR